MKAGVHPIARKVATPETMNDIDPDSSNPNRIGAKRGGNAQIPSVAITLR